jgi:hypothetical protein
VDDALALVAGVGAPDDGGRRLVALDLDDVAGAQVELDAGLPVQAGAAVTDVLLQGFDHAQGCFGLGHLGAPVRRGIR